MNRDTRVPEWPLSVCPILARIVEQKAKKQSYSALLWSRMDIKRYGIQMNLISQAFFLSLLALEANFRSYKNSHDLFCLSPVACASAGTDSQHADQGNTLD